ncbi:3,4-dihydroxy-2-butanone-4-phosphate synthase [Zhihengliuella sp.]|uniref:3,4-dihydroxy-2-butanone-4-phosphate synthase n=1 Tax=Zhihengliuella sp. TaxID=1954483 RepID=UPI00281227D9|nr:3,4-dihydroxy-2-butanone-4-phosphate synthase [Zhihengliuella sp.]
MSATRPAAAAGAPTGAEPVHLDPIETAVEAIAAGRPVVVVDDEDRENEGDIVFAAQFATPELMGWTVRYTSGVVCVPLSGARADALGLPPMVARNEDRKGTAYTVSCDAASGVSTGISAADRALTARLLAAPESTAAHFTRPGHVFPLRAAEGGVLLRRGHTEASVDLCRLAGLEPAGVIAELVHDDGTMMRLPALRAFADEHGIPLVSIEDLAGRLAALRGTAEAVPEEPVSPVRGGPVVKLPTPHGEFDAQVWTESGSGIEHFTLTHPGSCADGGEPAVPLVRLHSECLTGDIFASYRCDCGEQLDTALQRIAVEGGTVVYLRGHEGRGIGLGNKIRAYALQDGGVDTVEANAQLGLPIDARSYEAGIAILHGLGYSRMRVLTNNPLKTDALARAGFDVVESVRALIPARPENTHYLMTKRERLNHAIGDDAFEI